MQNNRPAPNDPRRDDTVSVFGQVNSLCQAFSDEWQLGRRPSIHDYLEQVPDASRELLFRNLLRHEIAMRRQEGELPSADEYEQAFSQYAGAVRSVFLQSIDTSVNSDTSIDKTVEFTPAAGRLGDYNLLRELGRGGMGFVFEAVHIEHGNHVALKTLPEVDGDGLH